MNTKPDKDVWGEANSKAAMAFAWSIIALAVVYWAFFK